MKTFVKVKAFKVVVFTLHVNLYALTLETTKLKYSKKKNKLEVNIYIICIIMRNV